MKHLNLLLAAAMLMAFGIRANATVVLETDHYFCGFDTEDEYLTWTNIDANGKDDNGNNAAWWESGGYVTINPGISKNNDEWLITPAITLSGEKSYTLKIRMDADGECIMACTMGSDNTVEAQTAVVQEATKYNGQYYVAIPLPEARPGTYHIGLHVTNVKWEGVLYIHSFELVENTNFTLSGTVTAQDSGSTLSGATITLQGTNFESWNKGSDAEGKYSYENLNAGTYSIKADLDGYYPYEGDVTLADGDVVFPITLKAKEVSTVKGKVVDEAGNAIKGASITLDGIQNFSTTSGDDGSFAFDGVRRFETFSLSIDKDWKQPYSCSVSPQEEVCDLANITMNTFVGTPANALVQAVEPGALVSWMMPYKSINLVKDNGSYGGSFEINGNYSMAGNVYHTPAVLTGMSWLATSDSETTDSIDIYVYSLGKDGSYSNDILFQAKGVPNKNYDFDYNVVWNEYTFPEPVAAPYGCIIAVGCKGKLAICLDYSFSGESVIKANLDDSFTYTFYSSFFIRGNGQALTSTNEDATQQSAKAMRCAAKQDMHKAKALDADAPSYKIWRFSANDKDNQQSWTALEDASTILTYTDLQFDELSQGTYQYAVQAIYPDGNESPIAFTNTLDNKLYTQVNVHTYTNTAIDHADGTVVKLENVDDAQYTYTAIVENGIVSFDKVRKGTYNIYGKRADFKDYYEEWRRLNSGSQYDISIELELDAPAPFNLQAKQQETAGDVLLTWNERQGIFDDFESMEDFSLNPAGETGWTYVDVDQGTTYGVTACQSTPYTNMYSPMAFMAFNPSATTPDLTEYIQPYSGKKVLVDVALENGEANNDYMFSPELSFDTDFTLSFQAAAGFYGSLGRESFMVGYTTDSATPDNVVWLTSEAETVGGTWTPFSFTMPQNAKHTVIRCVSDQKFFFMLDDIFIGREESAVYDMTSFNVEVDGESVGSTIQRNMLLSGLDEGRHIAKVQAVYPMSSGTKEYSDFAEITFTVDGTTNIASVQKENLYHLSNGELRLGKSALSMELYDVQGRLCGRCTASQTMQTTNLKHGVYIAKVITAKGTSYSKIAIK